MNVTALVDTAGDALERYLYDPYGVVTIYDGTWTSTRSTSSYDNTVLFTGRELDPETGLYYYRARYYSAETGRFVGRDPVGYEAGDPNLHAYVFGQPAVRVDPGGMTPLLNRRRLPKWTEGRMPWVARTAYGADAAQNCLEGIKAALDAGLPPDEPQKMYTECMKYATSLDKIGSDIGPADPSIVGHLLMDAIVFAAGGVSSGLAIRSMTRSATVLKAAGAFAGAGGDGSSSKRRLPNGCVPEG